jgi:hypothetical protein
MSALAPAASERAALEKITPAVVRSPHLREQQA